MVQHFAQLQGAVTNDYDAFRGIDTDGDGFIDHDEFIDAIAYSVESPEEAEAIFAKYAGDDDLVDMAEFKRLFPVIKPDMP